MVQEPPSSKLIGQSTGFFKDLDKMMDYLILSDFSILCLFIVFFYIFLLVLEQKFISSLVMKLPDRKKKNGESLKSVPKAKKITYNQDYLWK